MSMVINQRIGSFYCGAVGDLTKWHLAELAYLADACLKAPLRFMTSYII